MIRACCYPSGLIVFGRTVPKGSIVIARGPEQPLRDFIAAKARQARIGRRSTALNLLVPGMPEAENQIALDTALATWAKWIAASAPKGIRVLAR
jgi:hypothetical protein